MPTLIDMFMCNTSHAVHDCYKELKQWELTWEQFFTEVTVINHEEAHWDSLKRKEAQEGNCCPVPFNRGSVPSPAIRSRKVLIWIVLKSFNRN